MSLLGRFKDKLEGKKQLYFVQQGSEYACFIGTRKDNKHMWTWIEGSRGATLFVLENARGFSKKIGGIVVPASATYGPSPVLIKKGEGYLKCIHDQYPDHPSGYQHEITTDIEEAQAWPRYLAEWYLNLSPDYKELEMIDISLTKRTWITG